MESTTSSGALPLIRPYQAEDKEAILEIIRLNTPQYFAVEEEPELAEYLDRYGSDYQVLDWKGAVLGGGGVNYGFDGGKTARLSWALIHPDHLGKGWGRLLTEARIQAIRQDPQVQMIVVRTSQMAFGFHQKLGFNLVKVERDYWAEGYDLYVLERDV